MTIDTKCEITQINFTKTTAPAVGLELCKVGVVVTEVHVMVELGEVARHRWPPYPSSPSPDLASFTEQGLGFRV